MTDEQPVWMHRASAPQDGTTFLAALLVTTNKTGKDHWEYALMFFEEGDFLFCGEADTGWDVADYTHWRPLVPPYQ